MVPFNKNSVLLAPMAGVTDKGFRKICRKYGCDATFTEMISTKGIFYNDKASKQLISYNSDEQPIAIQIFGSDPECFKVATEYITTNFNPMSIDINMGCPAPKIFSNGDGCALMRKPELAYSLIRSVKNNTDIPVSVKFRSGISSDSINAVDFAKTCQLAGADFITIHGRTREQFYKGESDPNVIRDVVKSINIPVVANGDICDFESAKSLLEFTGAHSIMVGRASMGNPLIFNAIKHGFGHISKIDYTKDDLFDIALEHLSYVIENKGEIVAVKEFRKHILWYLKGIRNAVKYKQIASNVNTYGDCKKIFESAKKEIME